MKTNWTCCLFLIFLLTGCKAPQKIIASSSDLDGQWGVIEINGKQSDPAVTGQQLNFDIARLSVSGNTGCNVLAGQLEFSEKQKEVVRLLKIVTTRKGCMDMSGENELLKALREVSRYKADDKVAPIDTISLYGFSGEKLIILQKK